MQIVTHQRLYQAIVTSGIYVQEKLAMERFFQLPFASHERKWIVGTSISAYHGAWKSILSQWIYRNPNIEGAPTCRDKQNIFLVLNSLVGVRTFSFAFASGKIECKTTSSDVPLRHQNQFALNSMFLILTFCVFTLIFVPVIYQKMNTRCCTICEKYQTYFFENFRRTYFLLMTHFHAQ